jgi:dTDP-glucose 4,6-dehydratase
MFFHNYGVDVRVARAVNIYGAGDPNESRLIPQTVRRLLRGEPPLLHAGAAAMRRQYVYVRDVVAALQTIASSGAPGHAYCVGSPDPPMTVVDVMRAVTDVVGVAWKPPEVRDREARFQEIPAQSVSDGKLRALGWAPRVPFVEGVRATVDWYRSRSYELGAEAHGGAR